ncbi:MAG: DUF3253 domain-containing protein [Pricia sp.]
MLDNCQKILQAHKEIAHQRGDDKTYCPSEVAKKVFGSNWREHMQDVRKVADRLVTENKLKILQKGEVLRCLPTEAKGPIRLQRSGET